MSKKDEAKLSKVRVYSDGKLVREQEVRGGPAPGYVGKRKAAEYARKAKRKAS